MRDPKKLTIGDILKSDDQLIIPKYQRPYDWKADRQVSELFDDIVACIEVTEDKQLFLGTTIVDSGDGRGKAIDLIDGQQRTTTIMIFLIALREYAKRELDNSDLVDWAQDKIVIENPFPGKPQRNKLIASESISEVFALMCQKNWNEEFPAQLPDEKGKLHGVKRQTNRLKPVYKVLYKEIADYCKPKPMERYEKLTDQLLHFTNVIWIQIENRSEAFEIFERTNARGKGLEISDLLKNYLFSKEDNLDEANVEEVWKEITLNAGNSILRMLKHFWISRMGYIAKRDLYKKIQKYADSVGINIFTDELVEFSRFFAAYNSNTRDEFKTWIEQYSGFRKHSQFKDELVRICCAYRLFNIAQIIPVIFAGIRAIERAENPDKASRIFVNLLRFIEIYHFINNKVCNRIGNEVEKTYAEACVMFSKTENFSESCVKLRQILEKKLANQTEYVGSFSELSYDDVNAKQLIRYLADYMANVGIRPGAREKIYDYFDKATKSRPNYDIDHILPQKLAKETLDEDTIHEIGNLLVIPQQINAILGADDFSLKLDKLSNPSSYANNIVNVPAHVQDFIRHYGSEKNWGEKQIKDRTYDLAMESYELLTKNHKF